MSAARNRAEKSANVLSQALADRLRIDGTVTGRKHSLLARRQAAPTARGARRAGADPLLTALRRRLVPARLPRRGPLRRGAGAALPASPGPAGPGARPRLRRGSLPRRPSRRSRRGGQPVGALPAHRGGPTRPSRYPPRRMADPTMPELEMGRRRCADFQDALARLRAALAARRPRRPGPGPPPRRALPRRRVAGTRTRRPTAGRAAVRGGRGPGERRSSTTTATSRPTGSPPARRPAPALRRRGLAQPAGAEPGLRPVVVHLHLPRPHGRGRQPAAALPARRPPRGSRARPGAPARPRPDAYPDGRTPRRACLFAGYDRDGIVDDYVVHYLRELARLRRRLLPRRRRPRPRRARQARGHRRRGPGASRTRPTTSAPGRCWPATSSAGTGSTATTRWSSPTTAASWSVPSTRCSPRWTPARATGGACRPRRWSSTRTTSATTSRCRSTRPGASCSARAAGPTCSTCT